jgi:PAS domain S-box-containing protein
VKATVDDIPATELLDSFPEPMVVMESDGTVAYGNPAAIRLLETEALIGQSIVTFLPEDERERLNPLAWLQRWADEPDAPEIEHVHLICRTSRGTDKPVRVRVGRLRNDPTLYTVMLHDITHEQARQHEARQAHRLAARVLAISADAIVNVDTDFHILYANPSAEALFGYGSGELVGKPLATLLPVRTRDAHPNLMRRFAQEAQPARLMGERSEVAGLTRSGAEIPLEASITKVTLDQTLVFSAHLRDLSARKAAEAALAQSLASFATVFDNAQQAMALIAPDGAVLEMNAAAHGLLPPGAEPRGQAFAELPFWSTDAQATAAWLREAMDRCGSGEVYRAPATVVYPDGSSRQLDFSLTPVIQDGATFAIVAEARDLSTETTG